MIHKSYLTLNDLTMNDYLTNHDVHLNGGTDAEETTRRIRRIITTNTWSLDESKGVVLMLHNIHKR